LNVKDHSFFCFLKYWSYNLILTTISLRNWTGLGGQTEGHLFTVRLPENNINLKKVNLVKVSFFDIYFSTCSIVFFSIFKLGNVEALLFFDVFADNLSDLDGFGDAGLDRLGGRHINCDGKWNVHFWYAVLLCLKTKKIRVKI